MENRISMRKVKQSCHAACLALATVLLLAPGSAYGQGESETLPDWSGVWQMIGGTVFDRATVEGEGGATTPGLREHPPYNDEWEAIYERNLALRDQGLFPDPLSNCGLPIGFPRIMNVPDVYEFALTPKQVWILTENGPNILRIFTDGRDLPAPEDRWPTFNGVSVGQWEGDTLVFRTVSAKGSMDGDAIIDRTGLVLSNQLEAITRMRKIDDELIEAQMTIEDPAALTAPWQVTKQYRKLPEGTFVYDYACAENNRNPVDRETGRTLTLGPNGEVLGETN